MVIGRGCLNPIKGLTRPGFFQWSVFRISVWRDSCCVVIVVRGRGGGWWVRGGGGRGDSGRLVHHSTWSGVLRGLVRESGVFYSNVTEIENDDELVIVCM